MKTGCSKQEIVESLRKVLGAGVGTDCFIERATICIDIFNDYGDIWGEKPHERERVSELIDKITVCEQALNEFEMELNDYIKSGCEALGFSRRLKYSSYLGRELEITRLALAHELPRVSNKALMEVKNKPRDEFISLLIGHYQKCFKKRAGHSESAKFNQALKIILPAVNLHTKNPMEWIKDARRRVGVPPGRVDS